MLAKKHVARVASSREEEDEDEFEFDCDKVTQFVEFD